MAFLCFFLLGLYGQFLPPTTQGQSGLQNETLYKTTATKQTLRKWEKEDEEVKAILGWAAHLSSRLAWATLKPGTCKVVEQASTTVESLTKYN